MALAPLPYPEQLTPDLAEILGLMPQQTLPMAEQLRQRGLRCVPLEPRAASAWIRHWLIGLYLGHGTAWRAIASERLGGSMLFEYPYSGDCRRDRSRAS
jgi:hypothetical protein